MKSPREGVEGRGGGGEPGLVPGDPNPWEWWEEEALGEGRRRSRQRKPGEWGTTQVQGGEHLSSGEGSSWVWCHPSRGH